MDNQYYNNQYQQPMQQIPGMQPQQQGKSKLVAVLLAFFVGTFGVHNFYLGYNQKGIIQVVLTAIGLLTSCIFIGIIPCIAVAVWALVDAIFLLTGKISCDANGVPLVD